MPLSSILAAHAGGGPAERIAGTKRGTRAYLDMKRLAELDGRAGEEAAAAV